MEIRTELGGNCFPNKVRNDSNPFENFHSKPECDILKNLDFKQCAYCHTRPTKTNGNFCSTACQNAYCTRHSTKQIETCYFCHKNITVLNKKYCSGSCAEVFIKYHGFSHK